MHCALHTWSFRRRFESGENDFFSAVDWAAEHGFRGLEMMIEGGARARSLAGLPDVEPATIARAVAHAQRRAVPVLAFSTFNDFGAVDDRAHANYGAWLRDWIRLAADLGVPRLRFLTGYYRDGQDPAVQEARTRAGIEEIVPVARAAGIELATENHNTIFLAATDLAALARQHGPTLTLCPDPTNWVRDFFRAPEAERERIYAELAVVAPFATHAHLKVRGLAPGGEALLGYDLPRLLRILRDAGYRRAIALEAVTRTNDEPGDLLAEIPAARVIVERAITTVLREAAATAS